MCEAKLLETSHFQITVHTCLTVRCAQCPDDASEVVAHFATEDQLWSWVQSEGWTVRPNAYLLCGDHSRLADCAERGGHDWLPWFVLPITDVQARNCDHCSTTEYVEVPVISASNSSSLVDYGAPR